MENDNKTPFKKMHIIYAVLGGLVLTGLLYWTNPEKAQQAINTLTHKQDPAVEDAKKKVDAMDQELFKDRRKVHDWAKKIETAQVSAEILKKQKATVEYGRLIDIISEAENAKDIAENDLEF